MNIPESFRRELEKEFPLLRIRWSEKKQNFQIEQSVGRGCLPPFRLDPYDDSLIRARDHYWLVCEVCPGDRTPCDGCGATLKVPHLEFREVRCEKCIKGGKDGRKVAGYFPLGEELLQHLRRTDPLRGAIERMASEADAANQKMIEAKQRDLSNYSESAAKDAFSTIMGIPSVGYTGNTNIIHRQKGL